MMMLSPRGAKVSVDGGAEKKEEKKADRKKKLLLLGSSSTEIPQAKTTNSPSPIRRTKVSKQKYPTLNSPVSLSFDESATPNGNNAPDSPREGKERDKDKETNISSSSSEENLGGGREAPLGIIGRLRSFSIDRSSTGDITPRVKSPKKKESPKKKDSKDPIDSGPPREGKPRKDNSDARVPAALSSSSSRSLTKTDASDDFHSTMRRGTRRRKQLSQILEGLDVAGMSQWDETDEAWERGVRTLTAFKRRNKISLGHHGRSSHAAESSGSGSDGEKDDRKAAKKQRKKEEREKRKKEKAEEREKKATLRLMRGRKRGHTRSGSELSSRSAITKKLDWKTSEDAALDSPQREDLGTRAKSGVAMADLSPRGAQDRRLGDDWREELIKNRSQTAAPFLLPRDRTGATADNEEEGPGVTESEQGTATENLLTSGERELRAREVEEYNKKLEEDKKNRPHRVLDLLSEWEQMTTGEASEADGSPATVVAVTTTTTTESAESEVQVPDTKTPPPPSPRSEGVQADLLHATTTGVEVVPLRELIESPRGEESGEAVLALPPAPELPEEPSQQLQEQHQVDDRNARAVAPLHVSMNSDSEIASEEQERRPNEDVVEIEITRQDPVPTGEGQGTVLVETKKVTIQIVVKRRDPPRAAGGTTPAAVPTIKAIEALKEEEAETTADTASQSEGATSDGEEELFFSQENEAVMVSLRRRCSGIEEGGGEEGEENCTPAQQLQKVERELAEKTRAMAALRREIERLKARRKGFIRAARRTEERRSGEST